MHAFMQRLSRLARQNHPVGIWAKIKNVLALPWERFLKFHAVLTVWNDTPYPLILQLVVARASVRPSGNPGAPGATSSGSNELLVTQGLYCVKLHTKKRSIELRP